MPKYYKVVRSKGTLYLNSQTVRQLLYSKEVESVLTQEAEKIKSNAGGDGYAVSTMRGHDRVRAIVKTDNDQSANDNLDNNTLLKAVGV